MILVFTALIGPTESAPPAGAPGDGVRYVCFTDREAPGWECLPPIAGPAREAARYAKTHPLEADWSIWMDASFDLMVSPADIVAAVGDAEIAGFAHPDRCTVSDEAREIIKLGLAPFDLVGRQVAAYRKAGFLVDVPRQLTTTGLLVRRHSEAVARFNSRWWDEMTSHTMRDQLSVDFAAWVTGISIAHLPGHYRNNRFARYNRERHRRGRVAA